MSRGVRRGVGRCREVTGGVGRGVEEVSGGVGRCREVTGEVSGEVLGGDGRGVKRCRGVGRCRGV